MSAAVFLKDATDRMEKATEVFRNELKGLRSGRANPAMLDSIRVESYGTMMPVKNLANITCPDPGSLVIKPFNADDLKEIEKSIRSSDLGLAPNNDGKIIRLSIPAMSGDQRKKIAAQIKKQGEAAKVACRNIRRDGNKHFEDAEKAKTMTEDDRDKGKEKMQELLKQYENKIESLADSKTNEVMDG